MATRYRFGEFELDTLTGELVSASTTQRLPPKVLGVLHALLEQIGQAKGEPLLLCTDFKLRGSPIVRNEAEAVEAYGRSTIDSLVVGSRVYERAALPTKK